MRELPELDDPDDLFDAPIDDWTLDDLDRSADLESLRASWSRVENLDD